MLRESAYSLVEHLRRLARRSPQELADSVEKLGYRGQGPARRALCLMAYRHVERLRRVWVDGVDRADLPARTNVLCMGPTGCGKTFLAELLFGRVLGLPCVVVDITGYSETGYVGGDVHSIPSRLVDAAHGDQALARGGLIVLDEFDKLATCENRAVFAGAETTKDVSGRGVQRELLKMIEGGLVESQSGISLRDRVEVDTRDVAFVACGAFSGLKLTAAAARDMGFLREIKARVENKIAVRLESREAEDTEALAKYGFLPELIGRFHRLVVFEPLSESTLGEILEQQLEQHRNEFALEGLKLEVTDEARTAVIGQAVKRQTGARGLSAAMVRAIEDAAFSHFGTGQTGTVRVTASADGEPVGEYLPGPAPVASSLPRRSPAPERWTVAAADPAELRAVVAWGYRHAFRVKGALPEHVESALADAGENAGVDELVDSVSRHAWELIGRPHPRDPQFLRGVAMFLDRLREFADPGSEPRREEA
jgi:ATP-dependent Clp protease ATP-binding subunit ClpX